MSDFSLKFMWPKTVVLAWPVSESLGKFKGVTNIIIHFADTYANS